MGNRRAQRRTPLTRERVVEAALELLDEVGLDGLSVRGLARKLGVQVGALYWHVEGKQDLLEAIIDRMMQEFLTPGELQGEWEELVAEAAHRLRGVLLSHRDGARVLVSSPGLDPNPAESAEVFLGTLREAGFPLELAAYAMNLVVSHVVGFVLTEQSASIQSKKFQEAPDEMIEGIDPSRFPNLAEWVGTSHQSRDEVFAAQTTLIVNGLRAELHRCLTGQHRGNLR
jgi:TetR/AcrR family tetracycline transcriptional repressor